MPNRGSGDTSGWGQYQRFVLAELERLGADIIDQQRDLVAVRLAMATAKGRDTAVTALVSLVMSGVVAYIVAMLKG